MTEPEARAPGRSHPLTWARRRRSRLGGRGSVAADVRAGTVLGLESVPDGLAAGVLAGVNPLLALHGYLVGTLVGALTTSSALMTVQVTGAMAVVVSDVPQTQTGDAAAAEALALLALLTGAVMLVLGLARLGSLVRFVSNAVLVGFVNAVALSIVLSQLDELTGYASDAEGRVARAVDTVLHVADWRLADLLVAGTTVALVVLLERTRLGALGMVVAIVVASLLPPLADLVRSGLLDVPVLADLTDVPNALPTPALPPLGDVGTLVVPALSLAFVGLVQGAAISTSTTAADGTRPDASADFRGQGLANLGAGLLQGMPVAGSMSATNLVRAAGARTALANLVAALVMALTVLLLADVVARLALPALGGLLALVGVRSLRLDELLLTWRTGLLPAAVLAVTFVLTLVVPLQYAVLVGVGMSVVLHVARQANRVEVRRRTFDDAGRHPRESPAPVVLPAAEVVVLVPYGSLFFAAAASFEGLLPRAQAPRAGSVVVIRLRTTEQLGSTVVAVLLRYSAHLRAHGCRLALAGVGPTVLRQLEDTGVVAAVGREAVFPAGPWVGRSTEEARAWGAAWVAAQGASSATPGEEPAG